jgi:hypothetical protein
MRETAEFESLVREDKATRANFYGTYAAPITPQENVIFSFTGYYQPNIDETSDYRAVAFSGLTFRITERFSIDLAAEYSYNTTPALGRERRNTEYATGFSYRLK